MHRLLSVAFLPLLPACILVIDAGDQSDVSMALASARHPGFHALVEDLERVGWEVEEIDRRGKLWRYELEDADGHEATILVRLGPDGEYRIREVRAEEDASCPELVDLEALAEPGSE